MLHLIFLNCWNHDTEELCVSCVLCRSSAGAEVHLFSKLYSCQLSELTFVYIESISTLSLFTLRYMWHKNKKKHFNCKCGQTQEQTAQRIVEVLEALLSLNNTLVVREGCEHRSWTRWSLELSSYLNHYVIL